MDTIFSSATSSQKSAIKIIRVSGKEAPHIPQIFSFKPTKPRLATLRRLYDEDKNVIDDAIVIFFPGPSSVTGEDILEIHIHGSFIIEKKIYDDLDERLLNSRYLSGEDYTIADIGTFPWIARHKWHDIGLINYVNLTRWYNDISKREAVIKGFSIMNEKETIPKP